MIKIVEAVMTCFACPSQWNAITDKNEPIYVRYRWGYLSIRIGPPDGDMWDAVGGEEIFGKQLGDGFDGYLTYKELQEVTKDILDWPERRSEDERTAQV